MIGSYNGLFLLLSVVGFVRLQLVSIPADEEKIVGYVRFPFADTNIGLLKDTPGCKNCISLVGMVRNLTGTDDNSGECMTGRLACPKSPDCGFKMRLNVSNPYQIINTDSEYVNLTCNRGGWYYENKVVNVATCFQSCEIGGNLPGADTTTEPTTSTPTPTTTTVTTTETTTTPEPTTTTTTTPTTTTETTTTPEPTTTTTTTPTTTTVTTTTTLTTTTTEPTTTTTTTPTTTTETTTTPDPTTTTTIPTTTTETTTTPEPTTTTTEPITTSTESTTPCATTEPPTTPAPTTTRANRGCHVAGTK